MNRPDIKTQQPHTPHRLLDESNKKPPPRAFTGATEFVLVEWIREQYQGKKQSVPDFFYPPMPDTQPNMHR